jgi:hypothetical protein
MFPLYCRHDWPPPKCLISYVSVYVKQMNVRRSKACMHVRKAVLPSFYDQASLLLAWPEPGLRSAALPNMLHTP